MTLSLAFAPTTQYSPKVPGTTRSAEYVITLDSSYPTGGYTLTAATFGFVAIHSARPGVTSGGKPVFWVASTGKLKIFSAIGTEVSNATDLSTETVNVSISGI